MAGERGGEAAGRRPETEAGTARRRCARRSGHHHRAAATAPGAGGRRRTIKRHGAPSRSGGRAQSQHEGWRRRGRRTAAPMASSVSSAWTTACAQAAARDRSSPDSARSATPVSAHGDAQGAVAGAGQAGRGGAAPRSRPFRRPEPKAPPPCVARKSPSAGQRAMRRPGVAAGGTFACGGLAIRRRPRADMVLLHSRSMTATTRRGARPGGLHQRRHREPMTTLNEGVIVADLPDNVLQGDRAGRSRCSADRRFARVRDAQPLAGHASPSSLLMTIQTAVLIRPYRVRREVRGARQHLSTQDHAAAAVAGPRGMAHPGCRCTPGRADPRGVREVDRPGPALARRRVPT